jgi:hypothetical protein
MPAMPQKSFDDPALRQAMSDFLVAAAALDEASQDGGEARDLLDLAESKSMAAMALRRRLTDLGWTAPSGQRSST